MDHFFLPERRLASPGSKTQRSASLRLRRAAAVSTLLAPLLLASLAAVATQQSSAGSQTSNPQTVGCTLAKGTYTCNRPAFRKALQAAKTVTLETEPMDRGTAAQLRLLAGNLSKTIAPADAPGDLTFLLIPAERNGVLVGPSGPTELANLRIYAPGANGAHGPLLWAETYTGEVDRPWPTAVHALIQQFQAQFGPH